jgi:mono/diheme cytochrome c family protein
MAACAQAGAQTAAEPSRGELLYSTQCIECHNAKIHWRDKRRATDWASLKAQVRRWQARAVLNWSETDILEVTRHLNETIYHFPQGGDRVGMQGDTNAELAPPRRLPPPSPG